MINLEIELRNKLKFEYLKMKKIQYSLSYWRATIYKNGEIRIYNEYFWAIIKKNYIYLMYEIRKCGTRPRIWQAIAITEKNINEIVSYINYLYYFFQNNDTLFIDNRKE